MPMNNYPNQPQMNTRPNMMPNMQPGQNMRPSYQNNQNPQQVYYGQIDKIKT